MMESAAEAPSGAGAARAANDNADSPWPIVTFSPAELAQLVRMKVIQPSRTSPITAVLRGNPQAPLEARAATRRLSEKGILRRELPSPSSELGACLLLSLKAIARPQARLVISRYTDSAEPSVLPLFLGGELAVPAFLDDAGLHVGTPMERSVLCDTLEHQLASEDFPPAGPAKDRLVLPYAILETIEGLWCGSGRAYDQAIPRSLALEVLAHLPDAEADPDAQVEELLASGLAIEETDGLRFTAEAKPWMERVLSGHSCEISLVSLEDDPAGDRRPLRLLFLGAAGRRILCAGPEGLDDLEGMLLKGQDSAIVPGPWTAPAAGSAEAALTLTVLQHRVLRWYLRRLIQA